MTSTIRVQIALVTGARRGIGRGIAYAMADADYDVVINDIEYDAATTETLETIAAKGAAPISCWVTLPTSIRTVRWAAGKIKPDAKSVLIVVDVQNCFVPGGSLAVGKGDEVVPVINKLAKSFKNVVLTQDWHTPGHVSFASAHAGKKPFETTKLAYGVQVLWPDHCVQGTEGAALHKDLSIPHAQLVIRKGYHEKVDSYSAFLEADRKTQTGLAGYLKARGIKTCYIAAGAGDARQHLGYPCIVARAARRCLLRARLISPHRTRCHSDTPLQTG